METHTPSRNQVFSQKLNQALMLMRRFEKCFRLFHRDTRFYRERAPEGLYTNWKTEFPEPITYKIDLNEWKSELELIDFMVTYGELFFVNREFII